MNSETIKGNQIPAEPLVSIIVITYNSSKYVLETLESVKAQTYSNIELIVSDDCSTDDTVEICRKWIEVNKSKFVKAEVITVERNTGIPANCNRGIKIANGDWVKLIAGDDMLLSDCIRDNINFAVLNKNFKIFISRVLTLKNGTITETRLTSGIKTIAETSNSRDQYNALLISYFGNSPTLFVSKDIFNVLKYDERFKYIEDYPFSLSVTKMGFSFAFIDKETVLYRIHDNSVFSSISNKKIFSDFYLKRLEFDKIYRFPYLPKKIIRRELFEYNRLKLLDKLNLNHRNIFCRIISRITYELNLYNYL